MPLSSIYPPGVYFQEVEDTPRPAGRSGSAPTDRGRPPRPSTSPMTARASHLASPDTSSNASTGGRPQSGQRRGRYRSNHPQGIDRGPRRHSHRHLPRSRSRSGVYPPPPAAPSRQRGGCSVTTPCPARGPHPPPPLKIYPLGVYAGEWHRRIPPTRRSFPVITAPPLADGLPRLLLPQPHDLPGGTRQ